MAMTSIFQNIIKSIASDLPAMNELEKEIERDRRELNAKERDLRNRTASAGILCMALDEAGVRYGNEYMAVFDFCRLEKRRRENIQVGTEVSG